MIRITPIRTGSVSMTKPFIESSGFIRPLRQLGAASSNSWIKDMPILCWLIEHPEGNILIDAGQTRKGAQNNGTQQTTVYKEDELAYQLTQLGLGPQDIHFVVLTHLHHDHINGLLAFPRANIIVADREYKAAKRLGRQRLGYFPRKWPKWFDPERIRYKDKGIGPFESGLKLTKAGDIMLVPTPGHTPGHQSVLVYANDVLYMLAGDLTYMERQLVKKKINANTSSLRKARDTFERVHRLIKDFPVVYLPSHDPESLLRFGSRQTTDHRLMSSSIKRPDQKQDKSNQSSK